MIQAIRNFGQEHQFLAGIIGAAPLISVAALRLWSEVAARYFNYFCANDSDDSLRDISFRCQVNIPFSISNDKLKKLVKEVGVICGCDFLKPNNQVNNHDGKKYYTLDCQYKLNDSEYNLEKDLIDRVRNADLTNPFNGKVTLERDLYICDPTTATLDLNLSEDFSKSRIENFRKNRYMKFISIHKIFDDFMVHTLSADNCTSPSCMASRRYDLMMHDLMNSNLLKKMESCGYFIRDKITSIIDRLFQSAYAADGVVKSSVNLTPDLKSFIEARLPKESKTKKIISGDPCSYLGLDSSANRSEIKRAYRSLIIAIHPDKYPEEQKKMAREAMILVTDAYEAAISVLTDSAN